MYYTNPLKLLSIVIHFLPSANRVYQEPHEMISLTERELMIHEFLPQPMEFLEILEK